MKRSSLPFSNSPGDRVGFLPQAELGRVQQALSQRKARVLGDSSLRSAAVLVLVYPKEGDYCLLFNRRTDKVEFSKGEICFPGGSRDPQDRDLTATALRETHEEMGIRPEDVTLLGELDDTATRTEHFIHPVVGTIPNAYRFTPSGDEVAEVLEVPVNALLESRNIRQETRLTHSGQLVHTRSYAHAGHLIFGATARILQQLLAVLEGAGWPLETTKT